MKPICVLGLNDSHDASAALCIDGVVVSAIAEERLSRRKHHSHEIQRSSTYVLEATGISPKDLDAIVVCSLNTHVPRTDDELKYRTGLFQAAANVATAPSHHLMHAASAFFTSPFQTSAILVCDGLGTAAQDLNDRQVTRTLNRANRCEEFGHGYWEGESFFQGIDTTINAIARRYSTHAPYDFAHEDISLGRLYSYASKAIFETRDDAGKVMGLAAFGHANKLPSFVTLDRNSIEVNSTRLRLYCSPRVACEKGDYWQKRDFAARVQTDLENALRIQWSHLRELTESHNICIAGGVGLNCSANGLLQKETIFDGHYFFPAAGDDGVAIGAALYGYHVNLGLPRTSFGEFSALLGREYDRREIAAAIEAARSEFIAVRELPWAEMRTRAARMLASGSILGWFQGRSEFGPRALGSRCVLASPVSIYTKEFINAEVKEREFFRPLAPVVLAERVQEFFDVRRGFESPYMLATVGVRKDAQRHIRAAVHVDGSARIQTVTRRQNSRLYDLVESFCAETGIPMLLNTSLNGRNEPLVETPTDAVRLFVQRPFDALVIGPYIIERERMRRAC